MIRLEDYDYTLPQKLIAQAPQKRREHARLFVYDTSRDVITYDTFNHIGRYLPTPSLLVMNNTKVVPARLWLKKETGGKIQVLLLMNEYREGDTLIKGITDRHIAIGAKLFFRNGDYLHAVGQEEQFFLFKSTVAPRKLFTLLTQEGRTPIPPYIKQHLLTESVLRKRYQSVLAKQPASVAAPTASLHFTKTLFKTLAARGIKHTEVTLHVGVGTFAPIGAKELQQKKLFTEYYEVSPESAERIAKAKRRGIPVIPVGTTALRALESAIRDTKDIPAHSCTGAYCTYCATHLRGVSGATSLFIFPPFDFKIADALITNFHVPKSSLMLLVDAFLESKHAKRRITELYTNAITQQFRFFSFGDAMLIL